VLTMPMQPGRKLAMIALRDIGQYGAAAFERPKDFVGQAIDLAGDDLTMPEVAVHLSQAMGRPVRFQEFPIEQAEGAMGHDVALMFRWFNDVGYSVNPTAVTQKFGIPLTTFAEWVKAVDWAA
ncbi:MAG: NmrA family NAD(P)-binding protein, partial [Blastocatellia bacterium]